MFNPPSSWLVHTAHVRSSTLRILYRWRDRWRAWLKSTAAIVLLVAMLAPAAPSFVAAQSPDNIAALNEEVVRLYGQGNYDEALILAEKSLSISERVLGREHPNTLLSASNLALLYQAQNRLANAEQLYKHVLEVRTRTLGKEHSDTLESLNQLASLYDSQGRPAEAEPLLKQLLEARERTLGKEHPDTLVTVNNLAKLYYAQANYKESEAMFRRALESSERNLGRDHPDTLVYVVNLAVLNRSLGRYNEAELLYKRALETQERVLGKEHSETLTTVNNLAFLYQAQGRYSEAESLFKRALVGWERVLGPEHRNTLSSVNNLAMVYFAQGHYGEAEPLFKHALEALERTLGKDHRLTLAAVNNLAKLYDGQGRYTEAEPLLRRALEGCERTLGEEHPDTLASLRNLADVYASQGRHEEAELLYQRAMRVGERTLGGDHPLTLEAESDLATLYSARGRNGEAEPLYKRVLEAEERTLGREHPRTLTIINNLAYLYMVQGRYGEAEPFYLRALQARERTLGREHPDTLSSLSGLASLYGMQGRAAEAEKLFTRALDVHERTLGKEHPATISDAFFLAVVYFAQSNWARAAQYWRFSTSALVYRTQRSASDLGKPLSGSKKSEAERWSSHFRDLVKAVHRLSQEGRESDPASSREMFETAQWAQSSDVAATLAQMAARGAKGDLRLGVLIRERQDLVAEWRKRDGLRIEAHGQLQDRRDAQAETENNARLAAIDARIGEIDGTLKDKFPDYAGLASPAPLTLDEVQSQLGDGEALILFLDTPEAQLPPEETFIWVLTKKDMRWVRSVLGTAALAREVQALRCGLDATNWTDPSDWPEATKEARQRKAKQSERRQQCTDLTGISKADAGSLPFDRERAFKLYKALFGQVEDLIKGKQLLLVPSGPLTQLPFQVLITETPDTTLSGAQAYRQAAWLIRDHALMVLPAVSSLKALRRVGRPSLAARSMIGFGNPLLDGPDERYAERAKLARENQQCRETPMQRMASFFGLREGVTPVTTRGGFADVSHIRQQEPLPETAQELCDVARSLGADPSGIHLGDHATKREVKRLSEEKGDDRLSNYRIIHFATHGALAGQLNGTNEPGLILTPKEASEEDDGYLSASDVAGLKLDADLVILSACNTAAGGAESAEALSGLARAFIYAQARSLLVSHWAVNSQATVKLVTALSRAIRDDRKLGRAEALRQGMLALVSRGEPWEAHPANWGPFVLVGEGDAQ